jgi:hypothetical protein
MAAWKDVEQAEPEFAARVRRLFDAGRHKTIATLRADGSPRISGIECEFADGELRFGSMPGARKGADLRRDPRFALHGPTFHPQEGKETEWPGEAKIAGRAVLAGPIGEGPAGDLFLADISEVVTTRLNPQATLLVIESWTPQRGLRVVERELCRRDALFPGVTGSPQGRSCPRGGRPHTSVAFRQGWNMAAIGAGHRGHQVRKCGHGG